MITFILATHVYAWRHFIIFKLAMTKRRLYRQPLEQKVWILRFIVFVFVLRLFLVIVSEYSLVSYGQFSDVFIVIDIRVCANAIVLAVSPDQKVWISTFCSLVCTTQWYSISICTSTLYIPSTMVLKFTGVLSRQFYGHFNVIHIVYIYISCILVVSSGPKFYFHEMLRYNDI